jgi:hypothetical protein
VGRGSELAKWSQRTRLTITSIEKGMAQAFNNLSHPLSFTLNQRAIASTPRRPTKSFNLIHYAAQSVIQPTVLTLC